MVLPTTPPNPMSGSQILAEFGIAPNTAKRISNDLYSFIGGTPGSMCIIGAYFSGKSSVIPPVYKGAAYVDGTGTDQSVSVACDGLGNIYISGRFGPNTTISNFGINPSGTAGSLPAAPASSAGAFIAKWNSAGVYQGATIIDSTSTTNDYITCITCDSLNNLYACGYGSSLNTSSFAINPTTSILMGTLAFIAKWDSAGTYQGRAGISVNGGTYNFAIACDSLNNVYVCGRYTTNSFTNLGISNIGGATSGITLPYTINNTTYNLHLVKWNSLGVCQGALRMSSPTAPTTNMSPTQIACSSTNVYLCGYYYTDLNISFFNTTASGTAGSLPSIINSTTFFILKWDSSMNYQSSAIISGAGSEIGYGVICDAGSNVYASGSYDSGGTITNFANPPSGTAGTLAASGAFVAKWDSGGTYNSSAIVGVGNERGLCVTCDSGSNVYVSGYYDTSGATITNFGTNPSGTVGTLAATAGGTGAFVAKWGSDGIYKSSAVVDGVGNEQGLSVACDPGSNVYMTGYYDTSGATITNFGTNPSGTVGTLAATAGGTGAFVSKWK
jgi:hypothetical protein